MTSSVNSRQQQEIREKVRAGYAAIATQEPRQSGGGCCSGPSCCSADAGEGADAVALAIGYGERDLAAIPQGANMGLSCGNPTALAELGEGEVVVDLGSGGGFDIFIAGRRVGATGRAIGIDMTPEMLAKARRNQDTYREQSGLDNVEFRLGEIEHLPLADRCADVVISNCVINLSPNKPQVWREIARVLKPGGRVAVSDIALIQTLPAHITSMVEALVGCVAGAVLIEESERMMQEAGFADIKFERKDDYIDAMSEWKDPLYAKVIEALPGGARLSEYIASVNMTGRRKTCCC